MPEITPNTGLRALGKRELPHPFNSKTISKLEKIAVPRIIATQPASTPPTLKVDGDAYYVAQGAAGTIWEGLSEAIVYWNGAGWEDIPLRVGFFAYVVNEGTTKTYLGAGNGWSSFNEESSLNKGFTKLWGEADIFGDGIPDDTVTHIFTPPAAFGSPSFYYWKTAYTGYGKAEAALSYSGPGAPTGDYSDSRFPPIYPLYRYTGTAFRFPYSATPTSTLLGGTISISDTLNASFLDSTPPIDIVAVPLENIPHTATAQTATMGGSGWSPAQTEEDWYEEIGSEPVVLATLPGFDRAALNAAGEVYEESFLTAISGSQFSYIGFRFQRGPWGASFSHQTGDPFDVDLSAQLTVSSAF